MGFIINTGPALERLLHPVCDTQCLQASVLRLDLVHPVVSGNKWYKLSGYLQRAAAERKSIIITFGGAFSNHIVATAAACRASNLQAVGIIRGEQPATLSPTLTDAQAFGMQLFFVDRRSYREKTIPPALFAAYPPDQCLVIPEGGYGADGMRGAATLFSGHDVTPFDYILCAVGTGTTLAGIACAALPHQQVIGISVLKNNLALRPAVDALVPQNKQRQIKLLHDYHGGGYAKASPELFTFMNDWYDRTGIPSDFVYTGKLFKAFCELAGTSFFTPNSRVLLVHTGGLQGNRSLPDGTLIF